MFRYKGYAGKVAFDEDTGLLHGQVAGMRDVITFQGKDAKEVEKAFWESVDDYLAFCKERGEQPERPVSGRLLIRVGTAMHRRLAECAVLQQVSINKVICTALERELKGRRFKPTGTRR